MKKLIIHPEYILKPFHGGVKLTPPSKQMEHEHFIENLHHFSVNLCLLNNNFTADWMNQSAIVRSGFDSLKPCLGKMVSEVANSETSFLITKQHQAVKKHNKMHAIEYDFIRQDGFIVHSVLFTYPLYNEKNKFIGVLDASIIPSNGSMIRSMTEMMRLGLLDERKLNSDFIYFSKRESECLELLAQGKTTKEIARCLDFSARTVEHYLDNCK